MPIKMYYAYRAYNKNLTVIIKFISAKILNLRLIVRIQDPCVCLHSSRLTSLRSYICKKIKRNLHEPLRMDN